jgi:hypothetical protein
MRKKAKNMIKRLGDSMSSDKNAKTRQKETIAWKRLRDGLSPDEKVKMREKETIGRKRLRLAKNDITSISPQNDFECMKEAKQYLHRTQDPENAHKDKSIVCVICN